MTDEKFYLVSDLAAELGVPRTTLNDWLKRFDGYLDSRMNGKRRVYSAGALEVLKAVNRMRNEGVTAAGIEVELSKTFAVSADEVQSSKNETTENSGSNIINKTNKNDGTKESSLPALRNGDFEKFIAMADEISRVGKSRRRTANIVLLILLIISVFSIAGAWYMVQLLKLQASNRMLINRMSARNEEYRIQEQKKINDLVSLNARREGQFFELQRQMRSDRAALEKSNKRLQETILRMRNEQSAMKFELEKSYRSELAAARETNLLTKRYMRERENALWERENALRERDKALREKEKALREREKALRERDNEIIKLRRELVQMKNKIRAEENRIIHRIIQEQLPKEKAASSLETTVKKAADSDGGK